MTDTGVLAAKAEVFRALHVPGDPVVLANAFDVPSAKIVAAAGYPALATSSAGAAWAMGYADGQGIERQLMLDWCAHIAASVDLPVTFDLENGYGDAPEEVAACVEGLIAAGGIGCNIEDSTGDSGHAVYDFDLAVARIEAGVAAATAAGVPIVMNARTDVFFPTNKAIEDPLAETVRRGNAFLEKGAACVFVPFLADGDTIRRLCQEIDGPVNVLATPGGLTVPQLAELGVARVSIGGAFSRSLYALVRDAAKTLRRDGTFAFMDHQIPHAELNALFN